MGNDSAHRIYLQSVLALCETHMADYATHIEELKEKWA